MKRYYTILVFIFTYLISINSQNILLTDGNDWLEFGEVFSMKIDNKGYMWLLSNEGISKYDGNKITKYQIYYKKSPLDFFSYYNKLYTDSEKNIWEISRNGLAFKYNYLKDRFELEYNLSSILKKNEEDIQSSYVFLDKYSRVWYCNENEIFIYNIITKRTSVIKGITNEAILSIIELDKEKKFLITTRSCIIVLTYKNKKIYNLKKYPINISNEIIFTYYCKPQNTIVFCTKNDGIILYNIINKEISKLHDTFTNVTINSIKPIHYDSESLLIATNGSGMYKLNLPHKTVKSIYSEYIDNKYSVSNNIIKDFIIDNQNNIWISIYPYGILKYSNKKKNCITYKHYFNNYNSLSSNQINGIIEDSDGDYWFMTNNGISIYTKKKKCWINNFYSSSEDRKYSYAFRSVSQIDNNKFIVGGYRYGAFIISKNELINKNITKKRLYSQQITQGNQINYIYKENKNTFWLCSYEYLIKYNSQTKRIKKIKFNVPITIATAKDSNNLLVGTINGLYNYNKKNNEIKKIILTSKNITVNSIFKQNDSIIYIGTNKNGLYVYNCKSSRVKNFKAYNSKLLTDCICGIAPANNGNIFLSTDKGISLFLKDKNTFINRFKEHGLSTENFNPTVIIKTKENKYLLGSDRGAVEIDNNIFSQNKVKSKLVFSNLSVNYNVMKPGNPESPIQENIDHIKELKLKYNQNMFSINLSSINFNNQGNILYTWKLEGFYDEWIKPSEYDIIRYINLPVGKYKLKVRSVLLDNYNVLDEKDILITILPPFWKTSYAYIFYILLILSLIYFIYKFFWIKRERNIYNNKIDFFINTAHDIKTPLTLIKSPLDEILNDEKLSDKGMSNAQMALKNTMSLTKLTESLIDFEKERMNFELNVSEYKIKDYVESVVSEISLFGKEKNVHINIQDFTNNKKVYIDKDKMDSILNNLITNAIKYSFNNSIINIILKNDAKRWYIIITDKGIGIAKDDQKRIFKDIFRGKNAINMKITGSGIGMIYTHKLIKNHFGKISLTSTINKGTSFKLSFPIKDKHFNIIDLKSSENIELTIQNRDKETCKRCKDKFNIKDALKIRKKILIVEDNEDMCRFLSESLSDDYTINIANNGEEALDIIKKDQPSLIISDLMMPIMNGRELCERIKSDIDICHIPIIILTALCEKKNVIKGLEIKADRYITKPFDLDILKANISNLLENRHLINTAFSKFNFNFVKDSNFDMEYTMDQQFLIKVIKIIKDNLEKNINVEILCKELNMSRTSFYNKIKAITESSPSEFIRNVKMNEACKLLKSKRFTVAEVSDKVGFSDPKYFTDIFKKQFKTTPSEYMKQN